MPSPPVPGGESSCCRWSPPTKRPTAGLWAKGSSPTSPIRKGSPSAGFTTLSTSTPGDPREPRRPSYHPAAPGMSSGSGPKGTAWLPGGPTAARPRRPTSSIPRCSPFLTTPGPPWSFSAPATMATRKIPPTSATSSWRMGPWPRSRPAGFPGTTAGTETGTLTAQIPA